METKRQRQVAETVKRHFSMVLQEQGTYIYGAEPLVTVTEVKMSPDLTLAKIYLSIWNTENKQGVMLHLEEEHTRLRQALAQRLRKQLRRMPDIALYEDDTLDEMYRVDTLFQRLHADNQMGQEEE
ncbi:MAG: 30S ribosome-binding factor RbfA [Saprospiraceae bacterium]